MNEQVTNSTISRRNETYVEIFTDGACHHDSGDGGWGALLRYGTSERELWGGAKQTTNNQMELMAAIKSLEALTRPCKVKVTTDSKYVQLGMSVWVDGWIKRKWKRKGNKPVKNLELWKRLCAISEVHSVEWKWVKGHSGHRENEIADMLACRGVTSIKKKKKKKKNKTKKYYRK